ncbi:MAG: ATP-dependent nuclease, partial [Candidatus Rokuibacteriota bacterium]
LWSERRDDGALEIEVQTDAWAVPVEFLADSTEQIYVRPKPIPPETVRAATLQAVFVPAMTGLSIDEPVYQRPKIDQLLGQAKPGEILRNLLVEANASETAWPRLQESIRRLFAVELWPPDPTGAHILAEYSSLPRGPRLDIASAGSGFQQVLMLLTFLHTRPASVLLLDEPDAHLHVILQDAIYGELRKVAADQRSQLIIATHSEVIINAVEPRELCVMLATPRMLADTEERARLVESLGILSHTDIMLALDAPGVLYVEGHTDLDILREWARILQHPAEALLTTRLFWKPTVSATRLGAPGIQAKDHYEALRLVRSDLPGLELVDGDAHPGIQSTAITGQGFQRLRWRPDEIESYLIHPEAMARFVGHTVGAEAASVHLTDLRKHFEDTYPPAVLRDPLGDHAFLTSAKARTELLPPALTAAGLPGFPYTRYHEIAAAMRPDEIHPEVVEKLDGIVRAFRR